MRPFVLFCVLAPLLTAGLQGVAATAAEARKAFTLEQILSAPFPSALTPAPQSGAVAWILNDRGARNLWVAQPPRYQGRPVTAYGEDDGQEISQPSWTPDAGALVFVRGGAANRQGEFPNPLSAPDGVEQALWMVEIPGPGAEPRAPRRLSMGHSPAVSPRGDGVAFLRQGQIWWVRIDGSGRATKEKKAEADQDEATQLVQARGQASSLTWSPDGSRLAFVSQRGDHSFIAVLDRESRRLSFLDPSVDLDSSPAWSPSGDEIAFLRNPSSGQIFTFGPRRSGPPWSIRIAQVATGRGREVWRADEGPGSVFRGVVAKSQLFWAAHDRLVFPWEKTGWTQLYSVATTRGVAVPLTSGEFEVEHVALGATGEDVVFSSNQGDPHRRHIWRTRVRGGRATAVTSGDGLEWAPVVASDGAVAFLRSGARAPARAAVQTGSGDVWDLATRVIPEDFPKAELVEPQPVVFPASDGLEIPAQLFLPPNAEERAAPDPGHPALLFLHGGSRRQMLLGWHYSQYYNFAYALNQYLASRGYVVLAVNYRSGTGYGLEFREALDYGAHGASELQDVLGAALYLKTRPEVDPQRLGLWGGSYGGYLTALGLARASHLFAAGVDLHGVHDWNGVIRNFTPSYNPLKDPDFARLAFESSPLASVDTWRSPVLLIHGDDDRNVPFSETVALVRALRQRGVEFEQLVFPDEVHGFLTHSRWLQTYRATVDFFDRMLDPGAIEVRRIHAGTGR